MVSERNDRRVSRTRRALHQALMEIILEKRYDKITVQDIIDRADVGRSTFYAHFLDKDDLLVQGVAMFSDHLEAHLGAELETSNQASTNQTSTEPDHLLHSLTFFRHAYMHHDLYRAMRDGGGADVIMEAARRHLSADIEHHLAALFPDGPAVDIPIPVITNFLAGAMLSLLLWWLEEDRPCSPEEIDAMFQRLAIRGVEGLRCP